MTEETSIASLNSNTGEIVEGELHAIVRNPETVMAEAQAACKVLMQKIASKEKPVIVNGEQYLEFGDWQTIGAFYQCTVRTVWTQLIEIGGINGFESAVETVNRQGVVVGSAKAMCLSDEPRWKAKPLFQLLSMAQTRAGSKSLRMAFGWVAELAGYKSTPAEEMDGVSQSGRQVENQDLRHDLDAFLDEIKGMRLDQLEVFKDDWKGAQADWTKKYGARGMIEVRDLVKARGAILKSTPSVVKSVTPDEEFIAGFEEIGKTEPLKPTLSYVDLLVSTNQAATEDGINALGEAWQSEQERYTTEQNSSIRAEMLKARKRIDK